MKNLFILALIALLLGSTTASTAKADREGRALIGGIIGGLIIGSVLNDDHHGHHSRVTVNRHGSHCSCRGYNDYVSVKTWVNGSWSIHYDHCGRRLRHWTPGYFTYRQERVWVPHNRGCQLHQSPSHGDYGHDDHRGNNRRRR